MKSSKVLFIVIGALAGLACLSASVAGPQAWHDPLSYDAGGYWTIRVPVNIDNASDKPLAGEAVEITVREGDGTAALVGQPVASLRVVTAAGAEMLYGLSDAAGKPKRAGRIGAGDVIAVPVEVPAKSTGTMYLYAGNARAWLPPEWLVESDGRWCARYKQVVLSNPKEKPTVQALPAESCKLARIEQNKNWPVSDRWLWRVPLLVRNFDQSDMRLGAVLFDMRRVHNQIAKLIGFTRQPSARIVDDLTLDKPLAYGGSLADDIYVVADTSMLARSEKAFWLYISSDPNAPDRSRSGMGEDAAADMNLLANGDMEEGSGDAPEAWVSGQGPFSARRVEGGAQGRWCLELTVPADVKEPGWVGWRQRVPAKPLHRYLLTGHLRSRGVDGDVRISGHFLRKDGSSIKGFGTVPAAKGDSDWTFTSCTLTTPSDCAFIEVHLTTNRHGTIWHDGILLAECADGMAGEIEARHAGPALAAWAVNPMVKVFAEDLPTPHAVREVRAGAARNQYEAFQVAVRSPREQALTVACSPFKGPGGARIEAPAIYRACRVPIDFPTVWVESSEPGYHRLLPHERTTDGWPGWWPDPLLPVTKGQIALKPEATESLWFDVHIPPNAPPGRYAALLELRGQSNVVRVPVNLDVWAFTQPEQKHVSALYDLRRGGEDPFAGGDRDEMIRTWYRFLARYNISPSYVIPSAQFRYENGRVSMEAGKFDEAAHYLLDVLHVNKVYTSTEWDIFYACGWANPPKKIFGLEPFTPEYISAWKQAYGMFIDHITEKGWRNKFVFYLADEPHEDSAATISGLARIADMAKQIAPDVPIYSSTWTYMNGLANHIDLWGIGPHGSFPENKMIERRAAGDHFWFTTDGQMCTDTPLLAIERLLPWLCVKYDVYGYEFWGVSMWTYDPWQYGFHNWGLYTPGGGVAPRFARCPNGDGYLAYPGRYLGRREPVASIRLVAAREGVDDYEIFLALQRYATGGNQEALKALERVRRLVQMPNQGGTKSTLLMPDPDAFWSARLAAGEVLSSLITGHEKK